VSGKKRGRFRLADAVMRARMNQFVRDDQVAALGQCAVHRQVRDKAVGDEQRRLGTEESCRLCLQPLMLGRITA
jgi:hypothetical protein